MYIFEKPICKRCTHYRGHLLQAKSGYDPRYDPFASRGPSTKITIHVHVSGLRINSSDSEILDYLKTVGVNFRSNIIDECYKDKKGNVTKIKTGHRFLLRGSPQDKPAWSETVKLGSGLLVIGLFYRGQIRAQKAGIATGMGNGDTEDEAGDRETSMSRRASQRRRTIQRRGASQRRRTSQSKRPQQVLSCMRQPEK